MVGLQWQDTCNVKRIIRKEFLHSTLPCLAFLFIYHLTIQSFSCMQANTFPKYIFLVLKTKVLATSLHFFHWICNSFLSPNSPHICFAHLSALLNSVWKLYFCNCFGFAYKFALQSGVIIESNLHTFPPPPFELVAYTCFGSYLLHFIREISLSWLVIVFGQSTESNK